MMHDPHLSNYLKDLTILGYDISDYVHLTHSYILLYLLIRFAKSDPNYSLANTKYSDYLYNSRYLDTLEKYNLSPLPTGDEHVKSCIENLCNIIENFIKRQGNQYYFQVFTPGIVSNWNGRIPVKRFQFIFSSVLCRSVCMVYLCIFICNVFS